MATFNLKNKLSGGFTSSKSISNNYNYSDTKLLTRIKGNEADIATLFGEVDTLYSIVGRLTNLTNTHTSEINALESDVAQNEADINSLESSVKSLSTKLSNTNSSLNSLSSKVSSISSNLSSLSSSISSLSSRISSLSSRVSSLEASSASTYDLRSRRSSYDDLIEVIDESIDEELNDYEIFDGEIDDGDETYDDELEDDESGDDSIDDDINEDENEWGEEEVDENQKIDYMLLAVDSLTMATSNLLMAVEQNTTDINNINNNMKFITKAINNINTAIIEINEKIKYNDIIPDDEQPDLPVDPEDPDVPIEPEQPEEEVITITTKNNIIKTRTGKVINYSILINGVQSETMNVYVNGIYSHTLNNNVDPDTEITVFSEIIYQEMDNHMVEIMIESEQGTQSNSIQFLVDIVSIFETEQLVLSSNKNTIFCAQHDEVEFKAIINGSLDGYCNLYVNGVYTGFIQGFENGEEFVIFKQKVYSTQEFILQIEYPEGNRSNELIYTVIVDQYIAPDEENDFYLYSDEISLTTRSGEKVSYIASIRGLTTNTIKIYVNGSYNKTMYIDANTNLDEYVLFEEDVTTNRIVYIQVEDGNGDFTNILSYEVTLINNNTSDVIPPVERDLVINWDDLERYVNTFDQVVLKANISGLNTDWCNVYINGFYNRTLSNLKEFESVILHEFIAEEDIELDIQIEDANKIKSNVLKYCIHIKENIVEPDPTDEEVLGAPDSTCIEYSKLIGGNRSTWTKGNQELISDISRLSINCLTLSVRMLIPDHTSVDVGIDEEDLALVKSFMLSMRSQGLLNKVQIILEPCPCINKGEINEREFDPVNKEYFITNWRNEIIRLLNELNDYSFWGIYVNTNMDILYDKPLLWQEIYDVIKKGRPESKVMIKTNWWESDTDGEMLGLNTKCTADYFKIWDIIAISAYFPLASDVESASYADIYKWLNYGNHTGQKVKNDIRTLSISLDKPIMLGELGIPALDYAVTEPSNRDVGSILDETTQKNWYAAWHDTFINEDWFLGWSFYHMSDLYNSPYDPTNKSSGLYIASLDILNKYKK